MKISRTGSFNKDYQHLPARVQEAFEKKMRLFAQNTRHPSLRIKKMKGFQNRWEGSIDMFYRFTFEIHGDRYLFRRIGPHDEILRNP